MSKFIIFLFDIKIVICVLPFSQGPQFELQNQPQFPDFPDVDALDRLFKNIVSDEFIGLLDDDDEQSRVVYMDENRSNHIPKKAITGVFSGCSSDDSDSDSISQSATTVSTIFTICSLRILCFQIPPHKAKFCFILQASIQTCDSFGSSNHCTDHITDLQESPKSTIKLVSMTQEVSFIISFSLRQTIPSSNF